MSDEYEIERNAYGRKPHGLLVVMDKPIGGNVVGVFANVEAYEAICAGALMMQREDGVIDVVSRPSEGQGVNDAD